jgi:iron complex outermembrane recepter protein
MKKLFIVYIFILFAGFVQAQNLTGTVSDDATKTPLIGAAIALKGTNASTITDSKGGFSLNSAAKLPFIVVISMIGYASQEMEVKDFTPITVSMKETAEDLNQVVVSASRVEERLLRSPVSIEKMDARAIQLSPAANFYDALLNMKSVDMVTSSLTYKQINTRGFNSTGNGRFLQMVDGMDNQSAGLGFAMGNLFGPHDLDVKSVELIPGAASALYGPVAFNGMLQMQTKSAFDYQGVSAQSKLGVNHIKDGTDLGAKPFYDLAIRYAKAFNNQFAFKINAAYLTGTDWYANDYTDIDPNTPVANRGANNAGKNSLNIYGDEVASTLAGIGRVSRTGYEEKDLAHYKVNSLKLNGALHYRINKNLELIYQGNYSKGVAQYTGSSRFVINGFHFTQHRLELKGKNFYVRAYDNQEDSKDSYNTRSLGQHINRSWVKDLNENLVTPDKADATWFQRYAAAFNGNVSGVTGGNATNARNFADLNRFLPNSVDFNAAKDRLIATQGLNGAGIFSRCGLRHFEGMYDLSPHFNDVLNVQVGANYRIYRLNTNGTLFDDKDKNLTNSEFGTFVQVSKKLLQDKLKVIVSGRYDKNENFEGSFTPRASAVFSPNENNHFRASYQTGFRNPTIGDQYIKLNVGPIIILGGAPVNSQGLNAYENSFTAASVGAFAGATGAQLQQGIAFPTAVANNKDKLVKSNVAYIKPEYVSSVEIGYKGFFNQNLLFDLNYYNSQYQNFIINTVVIRTENTVQSADGSINAAAGADIMSGKTQAFQLYTNATDKVSIQGVSAGLSYLLPQNYRLDGNVTWAEFNLRDANPNNIPAFNTPKWKTNLIFNNAKLTENIGFSVAWHWQGAFDWYGTFNSLNPGRINSYNLLDAQVSYKIPVLKTIVKLGASNLTNQYIVQAYGSPAVGGLYYLSLNFDALFR